MKKCLIGLVLIISAEVESAPADRFEGMVDLNNCSGALVRFKGQDINSPALVLTNGHCVSRFWYGQYIDPNQSLIDYSQSRWMQLLKNSQTSFSIKAERIVYATMTQTDVALFEISESYSEIFDRTGIRPLVVSTQKAAQNQLFDLVSGHWRKAYRCRVEQIVDELREGEWFFSDSLRYEWPCQTAARSSGSPLVDIKTGEVIGIHNSFNQSGAPCSLNNPCEIQRSGVIESIHRANYGQQIYQFYTCLTSKNEWDFTSTACKLPHELN